MEKIEIDKLDELVKENMQNIGKICEQIIPEGYGFIFMTYAHGSEGQLMYISNSDRECVVKALEEFIDKTKDNYGNDTGKYGVKNERNDL